MERRIIKNYTPANDTKAWSALPLTAGLFLGFVGITADMFMVAMLAVPVGLMTSLMIFSSKLSKGALKQYLQNHPIKHDPDCIDCSIFGRSNRCEMDTDYYTSARSRIPQPDTLSVAKALVTRRPLTWQVRSNTINDLGDSVRHQISIKGAQITVEEIQNISEFSLWNEALKNAVTLK